MRARKCELRFDSGGAREDAGARAGAGRERLLVYEAGDYKVELVVHDGAGRVRDVHGQVVRTGHGSPTAGSVSLHGASKTVPIDEVGQFAARGATTLGSASIAIAVGEDVLFCTIPPLGETKPAVA